MAGLNIVICFMTLDGVALVFVVFMSLIDWLQLLGYILDTHKHWVCSGDSEV